MKEKFEDLEPGDLFSYEYTKDEIYYAYVIKKTYYRLSIIDIKSNKADIIDEDLDSYEIELNEDKCKFIKYFCTMDSPLNVLKRLHPEVFI